MKSTLFVAFFCSLFYSYAQKNQIEEYYQQNKGNNQASKSEGTVSDVKFTLSKYVKLIFV